MTASRGQHLQLTLNFTKNNTDFVFSNLSLNNVFEKYGYQDMINWAQVTPQKTGFNKFFLVGYQGTQKTNQVSLGLYNLDNNTFSVQMKGAVETNISKTLVTNFAALLFNDNSTLKVVVSVG